LAAEYTDFQEQAQALTDGDDFLFR